jgi:hypothetical protein
MNISIQKEGRRHYVCGETFPIKDAIKAAGCKWDADRRAWWPASKEVADKILSATAKMAAPVAAAKSESISTTAEVVIGRADYAGKTYYLLFVGYAKADGKKIIKLAFRDGSKTFWAKDAAQVKILSEYNSPKSIESLRAFADAAKSGTAGSCDECGTSSTRLVFCHDSSGLGGHCCPRCAAAPAYERSFG